MHTPPPPYISTHHHMHEMKTMLPRCVLSNYCLLVPGNYEKSLLVPGNYEKSLSTVQKKYNLERGHLIPTMNDQIEISECIY